MTSSGVSSAALVPKKLSDLGITPEGWDWRPGQWELAERVAASKARVVILEAECGTGKSIIPIAAARALGKDAIVLIQTIQLQEQYLKDIKGLVTMTGRAHDWCNLQRGVTAAEAPCTAGVVCHLKGQWTADGRPISAPECFYFRRKAAAARAPISILNYAYWLNETRTFGSAFNKRDWIICDEGHELDQILMADGVVELSRSLLKLAGLSSDDVERAVKLSDFSDIDRSVYAALQSARDVLKSMDVEFRGERPIVTTATADDATIARLYEPLRRYNSLLDLSERVKLFISAAEAGSNWVICEPDANIRNWSARPLFGKYSFRRILEAAREKVVIMSAYLAPDMLIRNMGLEEEDVEVIVAPPALDRAKSPIYYVPVTEVSYKTPPQLKRYYYGMLDELISEVSGGKEGELGAKGIIHVPSVAMRDEFLANSRFAKQTIAYDGTGSSYKRFSGKDEAIQKFLESKEPAILIGQSISTGLDLPGAFTWQIIAKLAFPPTTDPVIAARKKLDRFFYPYYTLCHLVQAAGRGKRVPQHDVVTLITDAQFRWFYGANREHLPKWFTGSLRYNGWDRFQRAWKNRHKVALASGVRLA